ncbi:MAG: hypothetical protein ABS68_00735 [Niastella sp. SCN 39-18]|nr:MAG: hypothetical protein ABS68_00735 [Niastella sp. SCN 39-18]OJW10060.1 MAG: hypothetical protein BGO53_05860 [Sphingobacteriales bacterium 39-19]
MVIKQFLFWLPMIIIAFANATLRELVFIKYYSEMRAHQLSTITLIFLCVIYTGFIFPYLHIKNSKQALLTGLIWVILTICFEFSLGRFTHKSWAYLLRDYNLLAGRIWLLFILCLFLLPYMFYMFKSR